MSGRTYNQTRIKAALNKAADEIVAAADLPDTGTVDALNLLVNAAGEYLWGTAEDLEHVVADCYSEGTDLDSVLDWIGS